MCLGFVGCLDDEFEVIGMFMVLGFVEDVDVDVGVVIENVDVIVGLVVSDIELWVGIVFFGEFSGLLIVIYIFVYLFFD